MPDLISHYRILERLGEGGMGIVYRARDERLERDVALKLLSAGVIGDENARRRFRREALIVSRLNHPNVGVIYDYDTHGADDFLVMEYVPGESLAATVARGPLGEAEVVAIGIQIADGLEALHELGVLHCDLKPANVVRTPRGQVKLLDFGLSRLLREGDGRVQATSMDGRAWAGTLPYMAPEQFTGARLEATTDLYALGVVLFELATGRAPHTAVEPAALIFAAFNTPAPAVRSVNPALSAAFESVIARALEKTPEHRFVSARAFGDALRALQSGRGVVPVPGAVPERPTIRSLVVLPLANLSADREQAFFADGMTEALLADLAGVEGLRLISRTTAMRYRGTSLSVPEIARELNVDAVVEGSVLRSGGRVRITAQLIDAATDRSLWAKSYDRPLDDVLALQSEVSSAIAEEIRAQLTPNPPRLAGRTGVGAEAYDLYLRGRYLWNRRTVSDVRRALEFFTRAAEIAPRYAAAHAGIADAYNILGEMDALTYAEARTKAREAAERALDIDAELPEALTSLGFVRFFYDWDWPGAEDAYRRAVTSGPGYATGHQWFSEYLVSQGRFDEAEREARHGVALDPLSPLMENALSDALFFSRRYVDADAVLRHILELEPRYVPALLDLGRTLTEMGRHDEAIEQFAQARALTAGERKPSSGLAYALARGGREAEARALLTELEAGAKATGSSAPLYGIAMVHLALGQTEGAFEWLDHAFEKRDQAMVWLAVHPRLDPLRGEKRFEFLQRAMGLGPAR